MWLAVWQLSLHWSALQIFSWYWNGSLLVVSCSNGIRRMLYLHEACAYSVTPPIYSWLSLLQLEWLTQCYLSLFCNPRPSNPRALPNPWTAHIHLRFSLQEVPRNPDLVSGNHHNIETHFATALADASAHSAVATVLALAAGAQIELHSSSQGVRTLGHQRPHCSIFICATISWLILQAKFSTNSQHVKIPQSMTFTAKAFASNPERAVLSRLYCKLSMSRSPPDKGINYCINVVFYLLVPHMHSFVLFQLQERLAPGCYSSSGHSCFQCWRIWPPSASHSCLLSMHWASLTPAAQSKRHVSLLFCQLHS